MSTSSHSSCGNSEGPSTPKQRRLDTMLAAQLKGNANLVTQIQVDNLLMKFITEGLMPFSLVEQPAFKEFVTGLQPNRSVMCRATVVKKIGEKANLVKKNLKTAMSEVQHIATTTDCWSARRRSYIGVTAHWIETETLQRKSCVLACRRLKGKHTFDVLAAQLEDIHTEFEIRSKVVKTTTDNGSNFVKAFSVFSVSCTSEEQEDSEVAEDPDEDCLFENVFDDLTEASKCFEYQLPPHHRCSAHTLNLISTTDAEKAAADSSYKRLSRGTFAKCQALWNKTSRSVQAAEKVKELCGLNLIKPNATRWNSIFMAVQRINRIIKEKGENAIHNVCSELGIPKYVSISTMLLH